MKRPNAEELFEYVSIPQELPFSARMRIGLFVRFDPQCRLQVDKIRSTWESYFKPEPDVMDSVMRVYSKLRSDETLILKGWKLCDARPVVKPKQEVSVFQVLAASAVAASVGAVVLWTGSSSTPTAALEDEGGFQTVQMKAQPISLRRHLEPPMARIRIQDRNSIQVHYMQPEFLQSIEFETTGGQ